MGPIKPAIRILNLEDNVLDSELIQTWLEAAGIDCKLARVETEADFLAALQRAEYDLIIADLSLPSFDGIRALELARQAREEVPFIFFSGTVGEEAAVETLKLGASNYVMKQRPRRLVPAIQQALEHAAGRRREAEALRALYASEETFRMIAATIDEVLWLSHRDTGKFHYISPAYERVWGRTTSELLSNPASFYEHLHPEDRQRVRAFQPDDKNDTVAQQEYRIVRPDGSVRWIAERVYPRQSGAAHQGVYISVATDITDAKDAERSLRQSERKYRQIVELTSEGIWLIDAQGGTTFVNEQMAAMLGYTIGEIAAKSPLDLVDPESTRDAEAELNDRTPIARQHEITFRKKNGRVLCGAVSSVPLFEDDGQYRGTLWMVTDITARKALEDQLRQSQKMDAVGRLAGGVAHDFNNLVMVINGYADMLLQTLQPHDPGREKANEIRKAGQLAADLTRQLLTFSRKQIVDPKILDLNRLITDNREMISRIIGEDIRLVTELETDLGCVFCDSGQMLQVVLNLVANSRDAMPRGGVLTIETRNIEIDESYVKAHAEVMPGPHVQLTVSDTGEGMAAETQAHIFEPFFTTKKPGAGTGLGLSTLYGIVKQAGGWVSVYSEPGNGTSFKIYLPLAFGEVTVEKPTFPVSSRRGTETVLLVEDQSQLRKLAKRILQDQGYTVLEAANGREALWHCERHSGPIHLLLTDVIMPLMNGREVATAVQKMRPDVRVLYMSGYTTTAIVERGVLEPGVEYLQKPFPATVLTAKIRELLSPSAQARILVVDDEEGVRGLVTEIMRNAGYAVVEAGNGDEAIGVLESESVDLVITDVVMPVKEGIETIPVMRHRWPEVKVIAMSGAAFGQVYLGLASKLGADAVLQKPVAGDRLLETVRGLL